MANWKWEGFNREGKKQKGVLDAQNERQLKRLLRAKGIRPTRVTPPSLLELDLGMWLVEKGFAKPFGIKELGNFTRQLAVLIDAGVPILQSLEILYKQERHLVLKASIKKIADDVGGGKSLFDAMSKQKGFSKLYCNLVKAGETGGILDGILEKLSEYMEAQEKIKKQIKSALTYPTIVVVVGIAVVIGMMIFVVPKFASMIESSGQEMPALTKFVMDASDFMQEHVLTIVIVIFVSAISLSKFSSSPTGKPIMDRLVMKIPVMGGIIIKGNLSSMLRTLSTMIGSGVALIDALDICSETVNNVVISEDIRKVKQAVTEGKTLAEPIGKIDYFPEMVAQMIKVGEQTGGLDEMMMKVSTLFETEVNDLIGQLTSMIEPIILVVLGGFVAVILIAMYLPVFKAAGGV